MQAQMHVSQKYNISLTEDLKDHRLLLADHSTYQKGDSRILSKLKSFLIREKLIMLFWIWQYKLLLGGK